MADYETNPILWAWKNLPPDVRKSYGSLVDFIAEMSPGAAIRDAVDESGKLMTGLLRGEGWKAAGGGAGLLTAMASLVPGSRAATKVAKEAAEKAAKEVAVKNAADGTLGKVSPDVMHKGKDPSAWAPQDWGDYGRQHGVDTLGPASEEAWRKNLQTVKTKSGREITVPGGIDGKEPFTYYDLIHLKAQGIDPNDLPKEVHQKIHDRVVAAMQPGPGGPSNTQIANQTMFGMISPNQPLTPNELALQRVMTKGPEDLKAWNEMIPYDYKTGSATEAERRVMSNQITNKLGLQAAEKGGIGASGGADYANIAEFTQKMRDRPDFYRFNPDAPEFAGMTDAEKWSAHVTRVMNETRGLAAKTGSLASVWQSPKTAAISAIDRHMATDFWNKIFPNKAARQEFEAKLVASFNEGRPDDQKVATFADMLKAKGGRGHFVEKALSYVDNTPKVTTQFAKTGEYNPRIPPAVQQTDWVTKQPEKTALIEGPYVRALNANAQEAGKVGQSTFANQWLRWDRIRGRLEPHEILFPGLEKLPRMSLEQMKRVSKDHSDAGYMAAEGAVRPVPEASRLGYFSAAPVVAGGGLLAAPDQADQAGVNFQEDMRRRRAALRGPLAGPVVYEDEERTF